MPTPCSAIAAVCRDRVRVGDDDQRLRRRRAKRLRNDFPWTRSAARRRRRQLAPAMLTATGEPSGTRAARRRRSPRHAAARSGRAADAADAGRSAASLRPRPCHRGGGAFGSRGGRDGRIRSDRHRRADGARLPARRGPRTRTGRLTAGAAGAAARATRATARTTRATATTAGLRAAAAGQCLGAASRKMSAMLSSASPSALTTGARAARGIGVSNSAVTGSTGIFCSM